MCKELRGELNSRNVRVGDSGLDPYDSYTDFSGKD